MINRSTFMKPVWVHFRRVALPGRPFDRRLFGEVLCFVWKGERVRLDAERERLARCCAAPNVVSVPARLLSEMEARIDGLKYLSARYPIGRMAAEINAEYAHA